MTIFQLLLFSCSTLIDPASGVVQEACRWDAREFYEAEWECHSAGSAARGNPVLEFSRLMGAKPRLVERHECRPLQVR